MALLWCDGFDHYGSDENNMLDGVYAANGTDGGTLGGSSLSTAHPATGTHGMFVSGDNSAGTALRKVLPASTLKIGVAARIYFDGLPSGNIGGTIFNFLPADATTPHISVVVDASGALRFLRSREYFTINGENGSLVAQSDPIIVPSANNHIEVQMYKHASDGWVRVAVNGVHRFQATGLNTEHNSEQIVAVSHNSGMSGATGSKGFYMDDLYIYDFTGDSAVDTDFCPTVDGSGIATNYIGELQVIYCPMNGDTAETDWVRISGSNDYEMVDEVDPDDATYIYSTTAGDLSEFDITDLPEDITYIRGVQLLGRMSKGDSGAAMTKFGMKSDASTEDAAERPITVDPTYWWDFMNTDPDTGARWTRAGLNAAWFRLTRSV